jgi:hypothetical protein
VTPGPAQECEVYLEDFQVLTAACDATSINFLGGAPSSLTVSGCVCHPEADGETSRG